MHAIRSTSERVEVSFNVHVYVIAFRVVRTSIPVAIVRVPKYRVLPAETRIRGDNQLPLVSVGGKLNAANRGI